MSREGGCSRERGLGRCARGSPDGRSSDLREGEGRERLDPVSWLDVAQSGLRTDPAALQQSPASTDLMRTWNSGRARAVLGATTESPVHAGLGRK